MTAQPFGGPRYRNDLRQSVIGKLYPGSLEAACSLARNSERRHAVLAALSEPDRVAASRARSNLRRYAVANRLAGFITLTSRHAMSREMFATATRSLLRTVRANTPSFPYCWVVETGKRGRTHVHMLAPPGVSSLLESRWSHGVTAVEVAAGVEETRTLASYLAKDFASPSRSASLSRYSVARGYMPEFVTIEASGAEDFIGKAAMQLGTQPSVVERRSREGVGNALLAFWPDPTEETSVRLQRTTAARRSANVGYRTEQQ